MKTCTKCNEAKPITEYYPRSASRGGYEARCKPCFRLHVDHRSQINNKVVSAIMKAEGMSFSTWRSLPKEERAYYRRKYSTLRPTLLTQPPKVSVVDLTKERIKAELKAEYEVSDRKVSQRKEGYVYVITNPAWPEWVKVGRSVLTERRFNSYQTSSPFRDFELAGDVYFEDAIQAEREVHNSLTASGVGSNGEWFKTTAANALSLIEAVSLVEVAA